jgi:hypothetical protein
VKEKNSEISNFGMISKHSKHCIHPKTPLLQLLYVIVMGHKTMKHRTEYAYINI